MEIPLRDRGVAAHPTWSWEAKHLAVLETGPKRTELYVVSRWSGTTRKLPFKGNPTESFDVEGPAEWNEYNALLVSARDASGVPGTYIGAMGDFESAALEPYSSTLPAHRRASVGQRGMLTYLDAETEQIEVYVDKTGETIPITVETLAFANPTFNRGETQVLATFKPSPGHEQAWRFDLDGFGTRIPADGDATLSPVQARNGRILMYRRHGRHFDIQTQHPTRVLATNVIRQRNPMLDRIGTRLVWAPNVAHNDRILLRNLRNGVTVALLTEEVDVREPSIGFDGHNRWIAYTAEASSGVGRSLYIAPLPRRGNYRRKKKRSAR